MPRGLSTEIKTAIAADTVQPVYLAYFDFNGYTLRTWTGEGDLSYDAQTWAGNGHLQLVPAVRENANLYAELTQLQLTGKPATAVDLSDPDNYQGRAVELYIGFYDATGALPSTNIYKLFSGTMSQVEFSSNAAAESWRVTAESRLVDLQRVKSALWTHEEQRSRYSADNGFAYEAKTRTAIAIFQDNEIPPPASRPIIYGQRRVPGTIVFAGNSGTGNRYLNLLAVVADHECQSIEQVYLNDTALLSSGVVSGDFVGFVDYYSRLGTDSQTYITELETEMGSSIWDSTYRLRGVCYIYLRLLFDEDLFGASIPDIKVEVQGKKLYDPRTTTTVYSTNAALAVRDYLLADSGFGAAAAEVDDTAFITAANVCEEAVNLAAGGTESRYLASGVIDTKNTIGDNLRTLVQSCAGVLTYAGGKFALQAGKWVAGAQTITEADLLDAQTLGNLSRRSWSNGAKGIYINAGDDWVEENYPNYVNSTFVSADGESRNLIFDLPLTTSPARAQRLAKIAVNNSRRSRSLSIITRLEFLELICGDIVNVTLDRLGYSAKTFRVEKMALESRGRAQALGVRLELTEKDSTHYDWDETTEEIQLGTYGDPDPVFYNWANSSETAVTKPSASPGSQSFSADLSVTVSHNTTGVNCHYTTDGLEPTQASPTVADAGTVTIVHANADVVLKLKNYETGGSGLSSATVEYIYTANLIADAPVGTLRSSATYNGSGQVSNAYALLVWDAPETTLDGSDITLEARATYSGSPYSTWDDANISFVVSDNHTNFSIFYVTSGNWSKYEARTTASGHTTTTVTMPRQLFPPIAFIVNDSGDGFDKVVVGVWEVGTNYDDIEIRWRVRPDIPESAWRPWNAWQNASYASNGFGNNLFNDEVNFINSSGVHTGSGTSGLRLLLNSEVYEYEIRMKAYTGAGGTASTSDAVTVTGPGTDPGSGSAI